MSSLKVNFERIKTKARRLKKEVLAVFLAYKRPDVSWYAKLLAIIVVGYALSPIDLIPDFIPVLGYLDDLILIPLGISLVIKLIPDEVMEECRKEAQETFQDGKPKSYIAGFVIILLWLLIITVIIFKIIER